MKISVLQGTRIVSIESPTAKKVVFQASPITQAKILDVGRYPNVTITDTGLSARVSLLEDFKENGTINGGIIF